MTVVLVHGNPETPAVRAPLVAALGRDDVLRPAPPGFGAPVPDGFAATVDGYRVRLVGELERLDGPVDRALVDVRGPGAWCDGAARFPDDDRVGPGACRTSSSSSTRSARSAG